MSQAPLEEKDEKKPELPRVMILGGCGFIGRHLVQMLIAKKVVSLIKVVDKRAPMTAYFPKSMLELYKDPLVQMIQCDLSRDDLIDKKKLFDEPVEYIINLCGETRFGQSDQDYQTKCVDTAVKCAQRAKKMKGLIKWIEVSTAQVYEPTEIAATETSTIAPYTKLANFRLQVEKKLEELKLPIVILRPSIVYGPGDQSGITPRLVCAACYKHAHEKMKFLWTGSLKINTVHVRDVCGAIWVACTEAKPGRCYNLSDKGDTTQGSLNELIEKIFGIKTGFQNTLMNAAASKMMATAAKTCNDKHLPMWSAVMKQHNLTSTPLSPYLDAEILTKSHTSVNGEYIEKDTKFKYTIPKMTVEYLQEVIEEFVELNYFPNIQKM